MSSFDIFGKETSMVALLAGVAAFITFIYYPVGIVLLAGIALVIGLMRFIGNKKDIFALLSIIVGFLVIIFVVLALMNIVFF